MLMDAVSSVRSIDGRQAWPARRSLGQKHATTAAGRNKQPAYNSAMAKVADASRRAAKKTVPTAAAIRPILKQKPAPSSAAAWETAAANTC